MKTPVPKTTKDLHQSFFDLNFHATPKAFESITRLIGKVGGSKKVEECIRSKKNQRNDEGGVARVANGINQISQRRETVARTVYSENRKANVAQFAATPTQCLGMLLCV